MAQTGTSDAALIAVNKIMVIVPSGCKPAVRLRDAARAENRLIDATQGRKTRAIIITVSNHAVLSGEDPETLAKQLSEGGGEALACISV